LISGLGLLSEKPTDETEDTSGDGKEVDQKSYLIRDCPILVDPWILSRNWKTQYSIEEDINLHIRCGRRSTINNPYADIPFGTPQTGFHITFYELCDPPSQGDKSKLKNIGQLFRANGSQPQWFRKCSYTVSK
jgi:hypothetical protein